MYNEYSEVGRIYSSGQGNKGNRKGKRRKGMEKKRTNNG